MPAHEAHEAHEGHEGAAAAHLRPTQLEAKASIPAIHPQRALFVAPIPHGDAETCLEADQPNSHAATPRGSQAFTPCSFVCLATAQGSPWIGSAQQHGKAIVLVRSK